MRARSLKGGSSVEDVSPSAQVLSESSRGQAVQLQQQQNDIYLLHQHQQQQQGQAGSMLGSGLQQVQLGAGGGATGAGASRLTASAVPAAAQARGPGGQGLRTVQLLRPPMPGGAPQTRLLSQLGYSQLGGGEDSQGSEASRVASGQVFGANVALMPARSAGALAGGVARADGLSLVDLSRVSGSHGGLGSERPAPSSLLSSRDGVDGAASPYAPSPAPELVGRAGVAEGVCVRRLHQAVVRVVSWRCGGRVHPAVGTCRVVFVLRHLPRATEPVGLGEPHRDV
jgi:hypothetical protein